MQDPADWLTCRALGPTPMRLSTVASGRLLTFNKPQPDDASLRRVHRRIGALTVKTRSGTIALTAIQATANDSAPCENTTTFTVAWITK